ALDANDIATVQHDVVGEGRQSPLLGCIWIENNPSELARLAARHAKRRLRGVDHHRAKGDLITEHPDLSDDTHAAALLSSAARVGGDAILLNAEWVFRFQPFGRIIFLADEVDRVQAIDGRPRTLAYANAVKAVDEPAARAVHRAQRNDGVVAGCCGHLVRNGLPERLDNGICDKHAGQRPQRHPAGELRLQNTSWPELYLVSNRRETVV